MSWVQFFQKENGEEYLNSVIKWITIIKPYNVISVKYLDLLLDKVRSDTNTGGVIQREDMLNFAQNCEFISINDSMIPSLIHKINGIESSWRSDIEKVYEIVTVLDEQVKEYKLDSEKEKSRKETLDKINQMRQQEENEKQQKLTELDNLLNQL